MSDTSSTTLAAATLVIEFGERLDLRRLDGDTTIGRDRGCTIVLDHPTVSRSHARLFRDSRGWHFEDLGSQNGSRLGDRPASAARSLADGCELRIGRVRAWFFTTALPQGWMPPVGPRPAGKLIRCTCGHIGWAPMTSGSGSLRCNACGREIARRDPDADVPTVARALSVAEMPTVRVERPRPTPAPMLQTSIVAPPPPTIVAVAALPAVAAPLAPDPIREPAAEDCAACHTSIAANEAVHTCPECAATMHHDCWTENRGCATYGCPQVGVLDRDSGEDSAPADDPAPATPANDDPMQCGIAMAVFALASLPLFGAPAVGYAAYQLMGADRTLAGRRRIVCAAMSGLAGLVGLICSARFWLGMRLWSVGS